MSCVASSRRFFQAVAVALVAAGCGGASSTTTTPPPTNTTPAAVVVQAGDGQQAAPGAAVATNPAVMVTNSAGQPVAGVTVTFTVDSGGGTLSATSATTGTNGVATAGTWTLGGTEGRNILKVTVGSLAPIRIAATAAIVAASIPPATIGTGGGSISVTQPGPLNGFSLTLPTGSYPGQTTWNISYRSSSSITRTATINPVSPVIHITGNATTYSANLLTLTIPAVIPAGSFPVIVMRDPASGAIEVMPTVDYDSTYVTGMTRHLNAGFFLQNSGTGAFRSAALLSGSYDMEVFVSVLTQAQLDLDANTGFQPGTNDWEFANPSSYPEPDGICEGQVLTAMWYFENQKQKGGPNLWGRFDLALGVGVSNRVGIRWGSLVQTDQTPGVFLHGLLASIAARRNTRLTSDQIRYNMLKAQLLVMQLPQLVTVGTLGGDPASEWAHALLAYRTVGHTIYLADPNGPGGTSHTIDFSNGLFGSYSMVVRPGDPPSSAAWIVPVAASAATDFSKLAGEWPLVLDGTIDEDAFPASVYHNHFGVLTDTIYVADTMTIWLECPTCEGGVSIPSNLPEASAHLGAFSLYTQRVEGQPWSSLTGGSTTAIPWDPASFRNPGDYSPFGYAALGVTGGTPAWLDWKTFVIRRLQATISPAAPTLVPGTPLALSLQVTPNRLPEHVNYVWDFGDGKPKTTVSDNPNVQHTWDVGGTYPITAQIIDVRNSQVVAKATATAITPAPYWRVDAITGDVTNIYTMSWPDENAAWNQTVTLVSRLLAQPNAGLISVDQVGNGTQLVLRAKPNGTYANASCCPPTFDGTEFSQVLGAVPAVNTGFGPDFANPAQTFWSQTTSDLTAGSMSSYWYVGTANVIGLGQAPAGQLSPVQTWSVSFTRSGNQLTGTLTMALFLRSANSHPYTVLNKQWQITATRIH